MMVLGGFRDVRSRLVCGVGERHAEESRASPGQAEGGLWVLLRTTRVGEGSWGKVEFSVFLSLRVGLSEEAQRSGAGYFPVPGKAGCARGARAVAPLPRRRTLPPARAAALPPRRRRAVDCGLGAAAASQRPPWSRRGAAAAPLEAGDVGEAVAAAAEAALRTRGKLLADRTPGRDVREPPLPPLTRRLSAQEALCSPRPTGQPARGGGGKPGSGPAGLRAAAAAEQPRRDVEGWRRRRCTRPRSGAAARDPQVGVGPAPLAPRRFAAHAHPDLRWREGPRPHPLCLLPGPKPIEFRSQLTGAEASHSPLGRLHLCIFGPALGSGPAAVLPTSGRRPKTLLSPLSPLSGIRALELPPPSLDAAPKLSLSFSSRALNPLLSLLE
ncbi:translation initiation factor IF-2-like [Neomonachus schauinslandi]|uniref:Translation initiation factor IF-2-like n=1 Tax=Neomonachus schauinslandi TaxID=29088 RepID=A0A8M1MNT9_NEOSC|nr:translation initiation factor IF-2-like [Neomonachus schauinslandi]